MCLSSYSGGVPCGVLCGVVCGVGSGVQGRAEGWQRCGSNSWAVQKKINKQISG